MSFSPSTRRRVAATVAALMLGLMARRRSLLRALLRALLRLLRSLRSRCAALLASRAPKAEWADPELPLLFGRGTFAELCAASGGPLYELWLNGLHLPVESPSRAHLRTLAHSPALQHSLDEVFHRLDAASTGRLGAAELHTFSAGLHGSLRTLLGTDCMPLLAASQGEKEFISASFAALFPPEQPLDLATFRALASLFVVRRVLRTLLAAHGLQSLRAGLKAPLVVDIGFSSEGGGGEELRIVHTVAPATETGVALGAIAEGGGAEEA